MDLLALEKLIATLRDWFVICQRIVPRFWGVERLERGVFSIIGGDERGGRG